MLAVLRCQNICSLFYCYASSDETAVQARLPLGKGREVAYIRLHYFTGETRRAMQAALLAGEIDGVDGYLIDLRNNPGEFLGGAASLLNIWPEVPSGSSHLSIVNAHK